MPAVVLAVPNISTGRDKEEARYIASHPLLLDLHTDPDHNRSVLTYGGPPPGVVEACLQVVERARGVLDLSSHEGVHPRFGVVDVVPFVPYGSDEEAAQSAAAEFMRRMDENGVAVRTYGSASRENLSLVDLRRHLRAEKARGTGAGVTCVGVREVLVAFNVNLTGDMAVARGVARAIRSARLRSLVFPLRSRSLVQVSMNLVTPLQLGPTEAFRMVAIPAREAGLEIVDCEVAGLVPEALLEEFESLPMRAPVRSIAAALDELGLGSR